MESLMNKDVELLLQEFSNEMQQVNNLHGIEAVKVKYLGKKSPVQNLMKSLKDIPPEKRPEFGKFINDLKEDLSQKINAKEEELILSDEKEKLIQEKIDISLPGKRHFLGGKHIITKMQDEMIDILVGMGFSVQYGPDVDSDYYNFEALNFPPDHPARDMQDTFYISKEMLLRTHTSNIQARIMELQKPPIRIIAPGKVYRNEAITARSHVFFQQIEAFYVDKKVSFADLLATLDEFLEKLFHREIKTRYRPSFFPFVEPGLEVDISCLSCSGEGCPLCKFTGWLEVAGAGMIHPEVLKNGGIDPEEYTGFAWGMGVERLVMLKYGVKDIRAFTENDLRFLRQFP